MTERLSAKLMLLADEPTFFCPGCHQLHRMNVKKPNPHTSAQWTWNNSFDKPTFHPSLVAQSNGMTYCHSWIRDGRIEFLHDSVHHLAGQTVDLPDLPEWAL